VKVRLRKIPDLFTKGRFGLKIAFSAKIPENSTQAAQESFCRTVGSALPN
jgi:hypothetical protein